MNKPKTVLLTVDSPWQRALANRIAEEDAVALTGIVVQHIPGTMRWSWVRRATLRQPRTLANKTVMKLLFHGALEDIASEELAWLGADGHPRPWPDVPMLQVEDINGPEVVNFLGRQRPQVGAVSGTRIIKDLVFEVRPPPTSS